MRTHQAPPQGRSPRESATTSPQSSVTALPAPHGSTWTSLFTRMLLPALLFGFSMLGLAPGTAKAQGALEARKSHVARDLRSGIAAARTPKVNWARDVKGVRHVQVIVVSNTSDPEMSSLRKFVLRNGGSILARHTSTRALTVQIRAGAIDALSRRGDVVIISPNRSTASTASTIEEATGAVANGVRAGSTRTGYTGLDGSGVGIAVLDSGIMRDHDAFLDLGGATRVRRNVNVMNARLASWTPGVDDSTSPMPGSAALTAYEDQIASDTLTTQDAYGHGTHVAAIAAGSAAYYSAAMPDSSGIAPNADIYDVRVLDDNGLGTVSDAIAGIEWAIFHAREYNIRVMNMSLAASSVETWQTDPLCAAVRSAAAAGITVVVAAGNFGQSNLGAEVYGAVGAPGNDPTVITVGSSHMMGTLTRTDDTINRFSSRGPTRSSYVDATGARVVDNLLKPDLLAPGNKIVGAAATSSLKTE